MVNKANKSSRFSRFNRATRYNHPEPAGKKIRKLDMRKSEEFNFMLGRAVEDLPDSVRGAVMGSIYSIASKRGIKEARDYILKKEEEGAFDQETKRKLLDLIANYSRSR
ncbi:MAG: hypothetical protein M1616_02730 [Candidatus Thermoplasmatota archaeon]|jgi:hypothetical protein|nr:hypothetical protein [Candidatus Thermoplasmatota archaeon]